MRVEMGIGVVAKMARPVVGVSRISNSGGVVWAAEVEAAVGSCIVSCRLGNVRMSDVEYMRIEL